MIASPIYLDYHATTPVDPRVLQAMLPYFSGDFGNTGSLHSLGEVAREAVDQARRTLADSIGAEPSEIVFTSGATESNNLAIRGAAERRRRQGDHLVTCRIEHPSVLAPCTRLAEQGHALTLLEVEPQTSLRAGWVDPQRVAAALTDQTCLVSIGMANGEVGIVQPMAEIAQVCQARGVLLHCDATQAVGKLPVDVNRLGVDLMSFSAHKIYGPKGVGALYVRRRTARIEPQIVGGGQEQGRRSGTLNVPGIVGLAEAVRLGVENLPTEMARLAALRDELLRRLTTRLPGIRLTGPALSAQTDATTPLRLPSNLNLCFPGLDGQALMLAMPSVAVSSGAACCSTDPEPSHVLSALGLTDDEARSSLRFGLGRFTTQEQIAEAAERLTKAAQQLRSLVS